MYLFLQTGTIFSLDWMIKDCFVVNTIKDKYGIISVSAGKLKCISCKSKCNHLRHTSDILEKLDFSDNNYDDFQLFETLSKFPGYRDNIYFLKSLSVKKIPYHLPPNLQNVIGKDISTLFIVEDQKLQIMPSLSGVCPACGGDWSEEQMPVRYTSVVLTRYHQYEAQCEYPSHICRWL